MSIGANDFVHVRLRVYAEYNRTDRERAIEIKTLIIALH